MLALVTIFLATLLISMAAIWLYRAVAGWQGFSTTVVARRSKTIKMRLKPQQGFITLLTPTRSKAKTKRVKSTRSRSGRATPVRLRGATGAIKAPWGW